jgi:hypothetical protein
LFRTYIPGDIHQFDFRIEKLYPFLMPRTSRSAVGGVVYHVLNRGNGRMGIFRKPGDYQAFAQLLFFSAFGNGEMMDITFSASRPPTAPGGG